MPIHFYWNWILYQFKRQHLLGIKFPNLHDCISSYQFEYFNSCEIFVIASFVELELLFELCLSTIACMGDFLLINHLNHLNHVNLLKLQFDQSLSICKTSIRELSQCSNWVLLFSLTVKLVHKIMSFCSLVRWRGWAHIWDFGNWQQVAAITISR